MAATHAPPTHSPPPPLPTQMRIHTDFDPLCGEKLDELPIFLIAAIAGTTWLWVYLQGCKKDPKLVTVPHGSVLVKKLSLIHI